MPVRAKALALVPMPVMKARWSLQAPVQSLGLWGGRSAAPTALPQWGGLRGLAMNCVRARPVPPPGHHWFVVPEGRSRIDD